MGDRNADKWPEWNSKTAVFHGSSHGLKGQKLVNIQKDTKGVTANEENNDRKQENSLAGFFGFLGCGSGIGRTWAISHSATPSDL